MEPHNSGRNLSTIESIQKEAEKIRRLYMKQRRGRPGRKPDPEIFLCAAAFFLANPEAKKNKTVFTGKILDQIEALLPKGGVDQKEFKRWLKSSGFERTKWENTWEWLRMGQKVWRFIEKNGPTSPREIQQRFGITAADLENLPCPTAAAFMVTKRPKKLFVDHALYEANRAKIEKEREAAIVARIKKTPGVVPF